MAVHSARSFRTGWITAVYCSCLLAGAVGWQQAIRAQTPSNPVRISQIEQWQGNKRLDAEPTQPPPTTMSTVAPSGLESLSAPLPTFHNNAVCPPAAPDSTQPTPAITPVGSTANKSMDNSKHLQELGQQVLRSTSWLATECQSALNSCTNSLRASGDRLVDTLAIPTRAKPDRSQSTTTVVVNSPSQDHAPASHSSTTEQALPWYKVVWLQLIVGGSALVVGPLMVAVALGLILRRSGLQFRVEVINSGQGSGVAYGVSRLDTSMAGGVAQPVSRITPEMERLAAAAALETGGDFEPAQPTEPEFTGEHFDLGPSYEEERLAKEESLRMQEQAILQEIFEQNLKLQEELRLQQEMESPKCPVSEELPILPETAETIEQPVEVSTEPIGYVTDDQEQGE